MPRVPKEDPRKVHGIGRKCDFSHDGNGGSKYTKYSQHFLFRAITKTRCGSVTCVSKWLTSFAFAVSTNMDLTFVLFLLTKLLLFCVLLLLVVPPFPLKTLFLLTAVKEDAAVNDKGDGIAPKKTVNEISNSVVCEICSKSYKNRATLYSHKNRDHGLRGPANLK